MILKLLGILSTTINLIENTKENRRDWYNLVSGTIYKILIVIVTAFVLAFVFFYWRINVRQDSITQTMNESIQVATMIATDNSTRVTEDTTISEEKFEAKFEETFIETSNYEVENPQFKYEYLYGSDGKVKAVKAKMTCDGLTDEVYEVCYIADMKETD